MNLPPLGKIFRFSVQIIEKCICETFPPPLHDLIISPHVKQPIIILHKKVCSPFLRKKYPQTFLFFGGGGHYALSSYLFPFLKVSSLTFVVQTTALQAKLPTHCLFKVIQYGHEIFETILSRNYKII